MARPLRLSYPGAIYHVMARGNAKAPIFLDRRDCERILEILEAAAVRFNLVVLAYCLMPNHYHLVIITPDANLSVAMKHINGVYSQWWNHRHERCGHTFQGRFKAQLIQRERYLAAVCRYVVRNPVRAGLASRPEDWAWSSYRASAGLEPPPAFFDPHGLDALLGVSSERESGEAFRQFVEAGDVDTDTAALIRGDTRFLGDEDFLKDQRSAARHGDPNIYRHDWRGPMLALVRLFGWARTKERRNALMRKAIEELGYSRADVARHLNVSRSTVVRGLRGPRRAARVVAQAVCVASTPICRSATGRGGANSQGGRSNNLEK